MEGLKEIETDGYAPILVIALSELGHGDHVPKLVSKVMQAGSQPCRISAYADLM